MHANIFIAWTPNDCRSLREDLTQVLKNSGMEIANEGEFPADEAGFKLAVEKGIQKADCFILPIGGKLGESLPTENNVSMSHYQFLKIKQHLAESNFRLFVWQTPLAAPHLLEPKQLEFIDHLKHSITSNMAFTNVPSPLKLADDIRSVMEIPEITLAEVAGTDIFLICNEMDDAEATEVMDMVSDIVPIKKLTVVHDDGLNYDDLSAQQINSSKLAVIYFRESADWALPFVQQVWKKIGGAASKTPLLLIGSSDPNSNAGKYVNAPKIISMIVNADLIPLEIKVQYDKAVESAVKKR
ncbi:MAG: DUF4062 domain-containing protein [Bacteroidetes bacterium]|nr:MAG: DUF4062 domain-containing protein [Bacteroidota bacterium]